MANLINDLGAAIVTTIAAQSSRFSVLGNTGGTLHVEYVDGAAPKLFPAGASGRCVISFAGQSIEQEYTASAKSVFTYDLIFDLVDIANSATAIAVVTQAMLSTFGDRGAQLFASFTDNGSNRLGKSGRVAIDSIVQDLGTDPDRPLVVATVSIALWHNLPLA